MLLGSLLTIAALAAPPPPVVGGTQSAAHPAVGVIRVDISGQSLALCSGSLVAADAVLTAAHCAEELEGWADRELSFALGARVTDAAEAATIVEWQIQPEYDPEFLDHDLAILMLDSAMATAPLSPNETPPDVTWEDERLTLVGFGSTGSDNGDIGTKRTAELYYLDFTSSHVMAYDPWGDKAACHGDSGGALLRPDGTLAGVVSYVYDRKGETSVCEGSAVAAIRVDSYWWWVEQTLAEAADEDDGTGTLNPPDRDDGCGSTVRAGLLVGLLSLGWRRRRPRSTVRAHSGTTRRTPQ